MAWIEYKMAYDMIPQSCIMDFLKIYKISGEVIKTIENNMKNWRVELTAERKSLTAGKIQRGTFQGNEQSPLLFVVEMIPLSHIHRKGTSRFKLRKS